VDFGVVSLPVHDKRLTTVLIHRDELIIIASPKHPIAKLKSLLVADLARQQLLVPKMGRTRDTIERLFDDQKVRPTVSMELDSSELMKRFVAANVGIGFIARSNVEQDLRAGTLVEFPVPGSQIRRDLGLVFRKDKALSRAARAFIDIAVKLKDPHAAAAPR
jgi:DNA-binding transcriptional LysR family regulator